MSSHDAFRTSSRQLPRFGVLAAMLVCGCSFGPDRVEVPQIDPAQAASAAVEQYDSDKDQNISQNESLACPALAGSFKLYDANHDGLVSKAEVESRLEAMLGTGIGRMPCMCVVYAGDSDRPIEGARVRVVPEPFLGGAIQPGEGVTNDRGIAKPVTIDAPPGLPGIEFGLYRVHITHDSLKIPARYNTATELGFELSPLERNRDTFEFRLKLP
ncbi:MAG: hypothetical protein WD894_18380 [Pirellulales bacterium]